MAGPTAGQPYLPAPGIRLSIGDPAAALGTDAHLGVVILDPSGVPSPNIVDSTQPFDISVFFKTLNGVVAFDLPAATFAVEFHIHELAGALVGGSPFAGAALVDLVAAAQPAGAVGPVGIDKVKWYSSTVNIPAGTLVANTTYRITVVGHDTAGDTIAFHDGTIIHTED